MNSGIQIIIRRILNDIGVELGDEFDRNFQREAFFSQAWQRHSSPRRNSHVLVDTGQLRRSIVSKVASDGITFESTLPYAAIHNDGGEIKVTERMKSYFWHKYYAARGSFGRKKDGSRRNDKRTVRLSTEAEFWKCLALMKVGKTIKIPKRTFIGTSPEVERLVRTIIEDNLSEYFDNEFKLKE